MHTRVLRLSPLGRNRAVSHVGAQAVKLTIGLVIVRPKALAIIPTEEILRGIERHRNGDWGEIREPDRIANERALDEGTDLFSVYRTTAGEQFWIATELESALTTVGAID